MNIDSVRAKFYVYSITLYADNAQVVLQPVTSGSKENETFWKYTPSGKLEMSIKGSAAALFEVGKEYYIDFTLAEPIKVNGTETAQ